MSLRDRLSQGIDRARAAAFGVVERAPGKLGDAARKAAAKTMKKKSVVTVAPEVDPDEQAAPPIPAGRKSLRVVN